MINWCVNGLLPCNIVKNSVHQRKIRFEAISVNTIQKYAQKLTSGVKAKAQNYHHLKYF